MAKKRSPQEQSIDPAAQQMLTRAEQLGISTAFGRADEMVPCNIGGAGMCCRQCGMGPCRLTRDGQTGVCGATIDTVQARNLFQTDTVLAGMLTVGLIGWALDALLAAVEGRVLYWREGLEAHGLFEPGTPV